MNISNLNKEQFTINAINKIMNGRASVLNKIQALVVIRRDNHGNDKIQNKCNECLTELYEENYKGGEL